jgi:hypothetical protein
MPLSAEEVEQLRRIHVLAQFGKLPAPMQALLDELRARNTGGEIIAPSVDVRLIPHQRTHEEMLDDEYADLPLVVALGRHRHPVR